MKTLNLIQKLSTSLFLLVIIATISATNLLKAKELYPVVYNDEIAYIDNSGNIAISQNMETPFEKGEIEVFGKKYPTFIFPDWAYFSEGKATYISSWGWWFIRMGKVYGVIDTTGKILIQPQENVIWSFKNGFAKTKVLLKSFYYTYGEEFTYIDQNDYIYKEKYDSLKYARSNHNYHLQSFDDVWYMIGTYKYCGDFSDGFGIVLFNDLSDDASKGKFNYINAKGETISNNGFEDVRPFSEGKGVVMVDSLWGVINLKGEFIIKPKYHILWGFKNGLARFYDGKSYGFIDEKGERRFPQMYISANDFSDGYALVQHQSNEYNFIDTNGNFINMDFSSDRQKNYQKGFAAAGNFSNELAPVMIDGRWGYINTKGELFVPAKYDFAQDFRDGFAQVWKDNMMYILNTEGKEIWTYKFH